jgi:hypothetical protein
MSDVPPEWDAYARLQDRLARCSTVSDHTWGLESALTKTLDELGNDGFDADRAVRTAGRAERYRAALRRSDPPAIVPAPATPDNVMLASEELALIQASLSRRDWFLLKAIASGHEYQMVAVIMGVAMGALRARVSRMRRDLTEQRARHYASLARAS